MFKSERNFGCLWFWVPNWRHLGPDFQRCCSQVGLGAEMFKAVYAIWTPGLELGVQLPMLMACG